ncbi:c-type cytochrome [Burkholderia glumae]|uniref:Cytochrome C n=3 Tax=Burkholderia glumae TaxID=337 RepID=A0AAP9XWG5_BURGL|nr:class I cytochrome c [Burkholderia glumae BGR1]AJY63177.1 putative cytochrome c, class I [Burkholderia glumae LMG 2196 = ATCC 33617]KHJ59333.1 cytochrome C [Burkholderia glumae]PJO21436.1 cytochrome C [Burkholderia glumae AU6208]NVE25553.1 cytochrome C [Burkholderia glumae]
MRLTWPPALALLVMLATNSPARPVEPEPTELVDSQHCMFCHTPDMPFLAPSFHQIAQRYRDVPHAEAQLAIKLRLGGRAHWGDTPMPTAGERGGPLSPAQARRLARWVLGQ